jgi:hypothetical protein
MVFSIRHPDLVELRCSRGKPRHPAQVVVTDSGDVPIERGLMFEEPMLPVYLVTNSWELGVGGLGIDQAASSSSLGK